MMAYGLTANLADTFNKNYQVLFDKNMMQKIVVYFYLFVHTLWQEGN